MAETAFDFRPDEHRAELEPLIAELERHERLDRAAYERILRRHPKRGSGFFSKSEVIRGYRHLRGAAGAFAEKVQMKPVRTLSGVAPVTVLTRPFPCPGECIFCPSDVRMPKSYLSDEPGAQRAAQHRFDPYLQTLSRLATYHNTGHRTEKVELIVLGGTWSSYPEPYRIWFVRRCFQALNEFAAWRRGEGRPPPRPEVPFENVGERVDGGASGRRYNRIVADFAARQGAGGGEEAGWGGLARAQRENETAAARCVGLTLETRPDRVSRAELESLRRLGATRIQIGYQSLSDEVLRLNRRGHDVAATRRAMRRLRGAGFKVLAHWMPNLYGSSPRRDADDFARIFDDPDFRPDELKIYPCSLIESAELMAFHRAGRWRPYRRSELVELLAGCLARTPEYCRLSRVIRDIPGTDIVAGSRTTNLRQVVEGALAESGCAVRDIRAREVRAGAVDAAALRRVELAYATSIGGERFLQLVAPGDRLAAFLRLSLPERPAPLAELEGAALLREVHVYGRLTPFGERPTGRAQHAGLGARLVERAAEAARRAGYRRLAVISAVGTRGYYRRLGFRDGDLYQHRDLRRPPHRAALA